MESDDQKFAAAVDAYRKQHGCSRAWAVVRVRAATAAAAKPPAEPTPATDAGSNKSP